jgi:hypothetical protein
MQGIVWYKDDKNMAINFMYELIDNYKKIYIPINTLRNSKNNFYVNFTNGDEWRILKITENNRGYKCNLSYYPAMEELSREEFNFVRSSTSALPFYAAVSYWPSTQEIVLKEEENFELPFN